MSPVPDERVGIVGLGAIGGSLALALGGRAIAWSRDDGDRQAARAAGIEVCAEGTSWMRAVAGAGILVIAVPLNEIAAVIRELLPHLPNDALVLHTASLQRRDALGLTDSEFGRVLGTHPIAGSDRTGFAAADGPMFHGAVVRAERRAAESARRRIERLWLEVGAARLEWSDADAHDALMSWISHLPQLTATALAAALAEHGVSPGDVGPGARDTTRLAASALSVWEPILRNAPPHTLDALRDLTTTLHELADALAQRDFEALVARWEQARSWRKSVGGPS